MTLSIFLVILGYLMGSICSAVIVCRLFSLPDPREEGSKNPGATNVLRIAGKQYAAYVMLADILKGTIPVVIARVLEVDATTVAFTALAAVIGHMYPIFFGFKGGKGVATAIGALFGLQFIVGVMVGATWLVVAKFSRYSSLASIISITLSPIYTLLMTGNLNTFPPLFVMVILILFKHKNNITRLIDGVEPKIKLKANVIEEIIEPAQNTVVIEREEPVIEERLPPQAKEKVPAKEIKVTKTTKTTKPKGKTVSKKAEPAKKTKTTKTTAATTKPKVAAKTVKKPVQKPAKKTAPNKIKSDHPKE